MAILQNGSSRVAPAIRALDIVPKNVDAEGWLQNIVDPISFHSVLPPTEHSLEGQAFVLLLHSAWVAFNKLTSNMP